MSEESKNLQPKETALPATRISETQVMALAQALEAVETYVPTTWVDDTEPDIDAEHLNHAEQGIKRVTDALNGAVATINNLAAQLSNYIPTSKIVDNLLSNDAGAVLSGKMGKQLSDLITANSDAISTLNSETGLIHPATIYQGRCSDVQGGYIQIGKIVIVAVQFTVKVLASCYLYGFPATAHGNNVPIIVCNSSKQELLHLSESVIEPRGYIYSKLTENSTTSVDDVIYVSGIYTTK